MRPGKPFDINDYRRILVELAASARDLQALVKDIDATTPHLAGQVAVLTAGVQGLVTYVLWRLIMLVVVILAAAIIYRLVTWQLSQASEQVVSGGAAERMPRASPHGIGELQPEDRRAS